MFEVVHVKYRLSLKLSSVLSSLIKYYLSLKLYLQIF